ncbi:heparinase II/III domain-containing protein [Gracilibacillus kekensis]|uniref:Heparinase II/III-like protein n=1 Tax=Gracilibacillus kekensis TaxID=1027249 RepID=A0A1M7QU02_9BACI|nr:heparinase II/III family protein [Gracilibacillus kekensis]SHN34885.1 Heparinase II/III-like protein [Gracilibacillus kekensis]
MSILFKGDEFVQLKRCIEDNLQAKKLWNSLERRVEKNTQKPGLIQPADTQDWWHLIWERLSDAAFVYKMTKQSTLKTWLYEVVMEICAKPKIEWIGPPFRNIKEPTGGVLETAHVGLGMATVLDLVPELFSKEEINYIKDNLKEKCQIPCKNFFNKEIENSCNWDMVLLNGYGTVSVILGDESEFEKIVNLYREKSKLYNEDSYGECLQYWNYATMHLSHLYEVLVRFDRSLKDKLDMSCYTASIPWAVASFMYMKPLTGFGVKSYPRSINFGDTAAVFRPSGDVLIHIANRARESHPIEAGLAKWLFDETYQDTDLKPTELASFGFFNTFQFFTLLMLEDSIKPLNPVEAGLPKTIAFETGTIMVRDQWINPKTILGIQGGYKKLNVTAHRHEDQNSFILSHLNERLLVDPGHCCYRLEAQPKSTSTNSHNTWTFEFDEEAPFNWLKQKEVKGNVFNPIEPLNHLKLIKDIDQVSVITSEASSVYGDPIIKAERTWITAMPNTLFIVDRIVSKVPVKVHSHFLLNNRDNQLSFNKASNTKLVVRRNDAAMKFFQVTPDLEDNNEEVQIITKNSYVHDYYHPKPNQKGQGKEGSGLVYTFSNIKPKKEHFIVYATALDSTEKITQWHVRNLDNNEFYVEPPAGEGGYSLKIMENQLQLEDKSNKQIYKITKDNLEKLV